MRDIYKRIRFLLKKHYPDLDILIQDNNSIKSTLMMFPIGNKYRFNMMVDLGQLLEALETKFPFDDKYDFMVKSGIPQWHINDYKDKEKKYGSTFCHE